MKVSRLVPRGIANVPKDTKLRAGVAVAVFALVGIAVLSLTRAATSSVNLEAESSQLTTPATMISDTSASGGQAVRFSAASNGGGASNGGSGTNSSYKQLSNPNAIQTAKNVYYYLQSIEGKAILAGQHEQDQCLTCESDRMVSISGKAPAVHGHDVAGYTIDPIQEAINDWNVRRQIPEFSWHISAPGTSESWTNVNVSADVNAALTTGTSQNTALVSKLDEMAARLKVLNDANVPVLWRPWHEINGGWFWWSSDGADAAKKLWTMEYDYFTKTKGLNNLIWVWSSAENESPNYDWYPGDQYVDITGTDTYSGNSAIGNWSSIYAAHKQNAPNKPVALTETDYIPDPADLQSQSVKFVWFLPWYGEYVDRTGADKISQFYNSQYVITADEMPDLTTTFQ